MRDKEFLLSAPINLAAFDSVERRQKGGFARKVDNDSNKNSRPSSKRPK